MKTCSRSLFVFSLLSFASFTCFGLKTPAFSRSSFSVAPSLVKWISPSSTITYLVAGDLFRSINSGRSFKKIKLPGLLRPSQSIVTEVVETVEPQKHFLVGEANSMWKTSDAGENWSQLLVDKTVLRIAPHPSNSDWFLVLVLSPSPEPLPLDWGISSLSCHCWNADQIVRNCTGELYVTKNFGESFKLLLSGVSLWNLTIGTSFPTFNWSSDTSKPEGIHAIALPSSSDSLSPTSFSYYFSEDLFASVEVERKNVREMVRTEHHFFLVEYNSRKSQLDLSKTPDGVTFSSVSGFPVMSSVYARMGVLDSTPSGLFFGMIDGNRTISLIYNSSANRYPAVQESIPFPLYSETEHRFNFIKAPRVSGFYLLNAIDDIKKKSFKTYISSDGGVEWRVAPSPANSSKVSYCNQDCNLIAETAAANNSNFRFSSFAAGLMLNLGFIGENSLSERSTPFLFFSQDAGNTWEVIKYGSYLHRMQDQGSLITIARNDRFVNSFLYSLDMGLNWNEITLDTDVRAQVIEAPFYYAADMVAIWGEGSDGLYHFFHLDYSVVGMPVCSDASYEKWDPCASVKGYCTVSGQIYKRKKREAVCFQVVEVQTQTPSKGIFYEEEASTIALIVVMVVLAVSYGIFYYILQTNSTVKNWVNKIRGRGYDTINSEPNPEVPQQLPAHRS